MEGIVQLLIAAIAVGLVPVAGVIVLWQLGASRLQRVLQLLYAFAAGALLANLVFEAIPHAFHGGWTDWQAWLLLLGGAGSLALLNFVLGRFRPLAAETTARDAATLALFVTLSDSLHSIMDGTFLAASFQAGTSAAVTTGLSLILHELPHELAEWLLLVAAGLRWRTALWCNMVSAVFLVGAAAVTWWAGQHVHQAEALFMPVITGCFAYILAFKVGPRLLQTMPRAGSPGATPAPRLLGALAGGLLLILLVQRVVHPGGHDHSHDNAAPANRFAR